MKNQVVVIHGGDTFNTYEEYIQFLKEFEFDIGYLEKRRWKDTLSKEIGQNVEVVRPQMPCKWNARYVEWKIWFEKLTPFFKDETILVGHSLGGIFLVKYLSENNFPKDIRALFLIAAPYDDKDSDYSLVDFSLTQGLDNLKQAKEVFIYHSKDDPVVPFVDFEKYKKALPNAQERVFEDRGHFNQEEFPELVEDIRGLLK